MEREEGSRVLVSNKNEMYHTENTNTRLTRVGYSSKQKHEVSNKQVGAINREKVAEMITSMTVKLLTLQMLLRSLQTMKYLLYTVRTQRMRNL